MNWFFFADLLTYFSGNGRIVFTYPGGYDDPKQTIPLGLAIDTDENLYLGLYCGGAVLKVNPRLVLLMDLFRIILCIEWYCVII